MNNTNWKPFIMFGLMIGFICFIGLIFLAMMGDENDSRKKLADRCKHTCLHTISEMANSV